MLWRKKEARKYNFTNYTSIARYSRRLIICFCINQRTITSLYDIQVKVKVAQSCLTLWFHGLHSPWNSPGQNTGVGSLSLHLPTQRSNPGVLHCRQILYKLIHKRSPRILEWVAYPFSSGSSWLRNRTRVSCIAGGLFTN